MCRPWPPIERIRPRRLRSATAATSASLHASTLCNTANWRTLRHECRCSLRYIESFDTSPARIFILQSITSETAIRPVGAIESLLRTTDLCHARDDLRALSFSQTVPSRIQSYVSTFRTDHLDPVQFGDEPNPSLACKPMNNSTVCVDLKGH